MACNVMWKALLLSCCWLQVQCQLMYPYISFRGEILYNHSFIDLNQVGTSEPNRVICHTNLTTCCSRSEGTHRGNWYFPNGTRLGFQMQQQIYFSRQSQSVELMVMQGNQTLPGIYCCTIAVVALRRHGETLYVGLYSTGGDIEVSIVDFKILSTDGEEPLFALTCISTGGPATNVTWTRDSAVITGGRTVLIDQQMANYTHTLTGRDAGEYTCSVSNDKPSNASASFTVSRVPGPTNIKAAQISPESVLVSWVPPPTGGDVLDYRVEYLCYDGGSEVIHGFNDTRSTSLMIDGLYNGLTCEIYVFATTPQHLPSKKTQRTVKLVPSSPHGVRFRIGTNSILLRWNMLESAVVSHYTIHWERTSAGCYYENRGSAETNSSTLYYTIEGLEEGSSYGVAVSAYNLTGRSVSEYLTLSTTTIAPAAPPIGVKTSNVTFSNITLRWSPMPCREQNGIITGYSIVYSTEGGNQQSMEDNSNSTEWTLSGLAPDTVYRIQIAGINAAGVGNYSGQIAVKTRESVYLSLRGRFVPKNGFVDINSIGYTTDTALICHTNRPSLPNSPFSSGDWYSPSRNRVGAGNVTWFRRNRDPMIVRLFRNSSAVSVQEGIYCCRVRDAEVTVYRRVCTGIYSTGRGDISVSGHMTLTVLSHLNGEKPQFNLTCISTGGPATTVIWTRDSYQFTEGSGSVLVDRVAAKYTHTLTVSRRPEGLYTCNISNNKPSHDSAQLQIQFSRGVENFSLANVSNSSITLSWDLTPIGLQLSRGYDISCRSLLDSVPPPEVVRVKSEETSATVEEIYPGIEYKCILTIISPTATFLRQSITFTTASTGGVEELNAVVGQRQVLFSWSPLHISQHSGVITNYTLSCYPPPLTFLHRSFTTESHTLTIAGFYPGSAYSCSVTANNRQGPSPPTNITFTTLDDYAYIQLYIGTVVDCLEIIHFDTFSKVIDITHAVRKGLNESCSSCYINTLTVVADYLDCKPDIPEYIIYRAKVFGTETTDSNTLISLIEAWATSKPAIILDQVKMRVQAVCTVAGPSPATKDECQPFIETASVGGSQSTDNYTGAVIGGVVAVCLLIAITIVIIVIVRFRILVHRPHKQVSAWNRAEEHVMAALPRSSTDPIKDISTYSNTAYEVIKHRTTLEADDNGTGEAGEADSHYAVIGEVTTPTPIAPSPREYETPIASTSEATSTNTTTEATPTNTTPSKTTGYVNIDEKARDAETVTVEEAVYSHIIIKDTEQKNDS